MTNPILACTGAAKKEAKPKRVPAKRRTKSKAQVVSDTSGDEAARSTGRPAVSRVTRANRGADAASDTAATHLPKQRGRKAVSRPAVEAVVQTDERIIAQGQARAAADVSASAPSRQGRPAGKQRAEQLAAAAPDVADATSVDPATGQVPKGSMHIAAAAAGTQHTACKPNKKASEDASAAAKHEELDRNANDTAAATAQVAPKKRGRKTATSAAEASNVNDAARPATTEGEVKQCRKRGRPAKRPAAGSESGRLKRQRRVAATTTASGSVFDFDH